MRQIMKSVLMYVLCVLTGLVVTCIGAAITIALIFSFFSVWSWGLQVEEISVFGWGMYLSFVIVVCTGIIIIKINGKGQKISKEEGTEKDDRL